MCDDVRDMSPQLWQEDDFELWLGFNGPVTNGCEVLFSALGYEIGMCRVHHKTAIVFNNLRTD